MTPHEIEKVVAACIDDPPTATALTDRLRKTLRPWEHSPDRPHYRRTNLLGEIVAQGQKTYLDRLRADESLREQHFTLLEDGCEVG